jgi:hypothetical protein
MRIHHAIVLIIAAMLLVGCAPTQAPPEQPAAQPEPVPQEQPQPVPAPEPAAEPAAPTVVEPVAETVSPPTEVVVKEPKAPYVPPAAKEMTGIVHEILSTAPGRMMGSIRPDGETRKYPFTSATQFRRFDKVRFTMDVYNEIHDVQLISPGAAPVSGQPIVGYQGQTVYIEGENQVIMGVVQEIRTSRVGQLKKFTGVARPLDGFMDYPFTTDTRFAKGEHVKLVLDKDRETVSMTLLG